MAEAIPYGRGSVARRLVGRNAFRFLFSEFPEAIVQGPHADSEDLRGPKLVIVGMFQRQEDVCFLNLPDGASNTKLDRVAAWLLSRGCPGRAVEKQRQMLGKNR